MLRPDRPLVVTEGGVGARLDNVQIDDDNKTAFVELTLENHSEHPVRIDAQRFKLARGADGDVAVEPWRASGVSQGGSGLAGGTSSVGVSGIGASGGSSAAGAGLGLLGGAAVGLLVLLPIAVAVAIANQVEKPPAELKPGASTHLTLEVSTAKLDDGTDYQLVLGDALGTDATSIRLPLVVPGDEHLGYREPRRRAYFDLQLGGGVIQSLTTPANRGIFDLQFGGGWYVGPLGLGFIISPLPAPTHTGVELRSDFAVANGWVHLIPFVDYEVYLSLNAPHFAHGPSAGLEANFSFIQTKRFGWTYATTTFGLYAKGGPLWDSTGSPGYHFRAGVSVGF